MADIKYITQLTKSDIGKMLGAANARAGRGIKIERDSSGGMTVKLDEDVITDIIWCFIRSGMANATVAHTIKDTRGKYRTDPNCYT